MASSSSSRKSVQAELTHIPYSRQRLCIVLRDTERALRNCHTTKGILTVHVE